MITYCGFLLIVLSLISSNSANLIPKRGHPNRHRLRASEIIAPKRDVTFEDVRRSRPLQNGGLNNMAVKLLELNNVFELADVLNSDVRETATVSNVPVPIKRQSVSDNVPPKEQRFVIDEDEPVGNYDKNGMIFLTKPKKRDNKNVNYLMEKVIKYKLRNNEKRHLRQPFNNVFSHSEIDTLKKIVRAIDQEDVAEKRENVVPRIEIDFADLVE